MRKLKLLVTTVALLVITTAIATAGTLRTFVPAERWETGTFLSCNGCSAGLATGSLRIELPASAQQNVAGGLSRGAARDLRAETQLLVLVLALDQETAEAAPYLVIGLDAEQNGQLASGCSALFQLTGLVPGAWSLVSVPVSAVECNQNYGIQDLRRVNLVQVQVYSDGTRSLALEVGAVGTIR